MSKTEQPIVQDVAVPHNRPLLAFVFAAPIGVLGGLIGLGGAEFRLPVLAGPLGYTARKAVPLNLAVSLVTLAASFATRSSTLSLATLGPLVPAMLSLIAGAVVTAFFGATLASRLSNEQLEKIILVLLLVIGAALIIEGFLPQNIPALLPNEAIWQVPVGLLLGLAIGMVSSLLGVAGGELIIPTLVFVYGADIKTAGTASLIISLPTVLVGILRYAGRGAYKERRDFTETIAPMGVGSVIGAVVGGLLVGIIAQAVLKVGLGLILIISAYRIFSHARRKPA
jgi:uncharacterized membrane protein YfcA